LLDHALLDESSDSAEVDAQMLGCLVEEQREEAVATEITKHAMILPSDCSQDFRLHKT
jgi:hypothetical protein